MLRNFTNVLYHFAPKLRTFLPKQYNFIVFLVTSTTPGQPMQLQVRVQLRKNNADYGEVSNAATTVVSP
ncbi:MAG: hypothetical protein ABL952_12640 [Pyrinomonadaceae bacterium]